MVFPVKLTRYNCYCGVYGTSFEGKEIASVPQNPEMFGEMFGEMCA
jgi:hypothetical protein